MHDRQTVVGLAHHQRCGSSEFICECYFGDAHRPAEKIGGADKTHQRRQSGGAQRDANDAIAPGAAKTIVDDNTEVGVKSCIQPRLERGARGIRIRGQQQCALVAVLDDQCSTDRRPRWRLQNQGDA